MSLLDLSFIKEMDPFYFNMLLSVGGGLALAATRRISTPFTGEYFYRPLINLPRSSFVRQSQFIGKNIRQPVMDLESLTEQHDFAHEGDLVDRGALAERRMEERITGTSDIPIYSRTLLEQRGSIDYVIAFTHQNTKTNALSTQAVAHAICMELAKQGKKSKAYAIGSDLIQLQEGNPSAILTAPKQSGCNLYQSLERIYSGNFHNPTYAFVIVDSHAGITDQSNQRETLRTMMTKDRVITCFIEIGKQQTPYTMQRMASNLDMPYVSVMGNYRQAGHALLPAMEEARSKMKNML